MARRSTPPMSPAQRRKLILELKILAQLETEATMDKYVHVSRAYDMGMTVEELGKVYGVAGNTAHRWKNLGQEERERRRKEDPES